MKLPKHISLTLEHNPHEISYEKVETYIHHSEWDEDFVSEEEKQLAIKNNDYWVATWYPSTPVGHCQISAHNLEVLLKYLSEQE